MPILERRPYVDTDMDRFFLFVYTWGEGKTTLFAGVSDGVLAGLVMAIGFFV